MRVVFAGTPSTALPSLDAIASSSHDLVAVVTRPDAPAGRGRHLEPSPVRARAEDLGLPVLTPATPRDPGFLDQLRSIAPGACPIVAYGALLPPAALEIPTLGWVNLHFSLLPAWRGAAPVQAALMAGDEVTGATTFVVEAGLDTGPVLGVMTETILPRDTAGDLLDRLARAGAGLLLASLDGLESGELTAVPQSAQGVSRAPKIDVDDARVRWEEPAFAVDRRVRACTPDPGAWTTFRGARLKIGPVTLSAAGVDEVPGTLAVTRRAVLVQTGAGGVELAEVQARGKRPMAAADWARGVRIASGERLGP